MDYARDVRPVRSYSFPVAYAVMTRKTTAVLQRLHDLAPHFQPIQVITDFEEAPMAAVRAVFGDQVTLTGCWFHCAQVVMKLK